METVEQYNKQRDDLKEEIDQKLKERSNNNKLLKKAEDDSHFMDENLLNNFCNKNNISFSIFRVFNIYGPKENFSIISKIIKPQVNYYEKMIQTAQIETSKGY